MQHDLKYKPSLRPLVRLDPVLRSAAFLPSLGRMVHANPSKVCGYHTNQYHTFHRCEIEGLPPFKTKKGHTFSLLYDYLTSVKVAGLASNLEVKVAIWWVQEAFSLPHNRRQEMETKSVCTVSGFSDEYCVWCSRKLVQYTWCPSTQQ